MDSHDCCLTIEERKEGRKNEKERKKKENEELEKKRKENHSSEYRRHWKNPQVISQNVMLGKNTGWEKQK